MIAKKTKLTAPMKKALLEDAFSTLYDPELRKAMQMAKTAAEYQVETFLKGEQLTAKATEMLVSRYDVRMVTFQQVQLPGYIEFNDHSGEKPVTRSAGAPHDEVPMIERNEVTYLRKGWFLRLKSPITLPTIGKYERYLYAGGGYWEGPEGYEGKAPARLRILHNNGSHELEILKSNPFIHDQVLEAYRATYRYEADAIALIENFHLLLKAAKNVEMVQDFYPRAKAICAPLEVVPDLPAFINTALLDRMKGMEFDPVKLAA